MLKRYFRENEFFRNVSVLVSGTVIAQIIPILFTPVLSRIYSPEDFGFYGFYLSIISVFTVIASGRFHLAQFISKRSSKTVYILKTAIIFSVGFSGLVSVFSAFYSFGMGESLWYVLLGVFVFNASVIESFKIYANVNTRYKLMSYNMIVRSLIANFVFLILGVLKFGKDGLMLGLILSQLFQVLHFSFVFRKSLFRYKINLRLLKATIITYKNFLIHSSFSSLANSLSIQLPTFFLNTYYNAASVGQYFQSYKLLTLPNSFIAKAFGSVFAQKAAENFNNNLALDKVIISLYKKLVLISFLPFTILLIYGDTIISFVLGSPWEEAGKFAQIISPWIYINFIVLPFTYLFEILQKQKQFSVFNIVLLLSRLLSLYLGFVFGDVYLSILYFSISSFLVYSGMLFYLFKITKVKGLYNYIMYIVLFSMATVLLYLLNLYL